MNRFARIMQFLGWVGVIALSGVWAQGFAVHEDTPRLARHTAVALVAACLCVLPRFWTMAYLLFAERGRAAQRRKSGAGALYSGSVRQLASGRHLRRWAIFGSATALVGLAGSFALAGSVLLRQVSPALHATAGVGAIALQAVALLLERRALLGDAAEMRQMSGGPDPAAAGLRPRVAGASNGAS